MGQFLFLQVSHIIMSTKSILIVDDSPIIVDRLRHLIKRSGSEGPVRNADDYSSALAMLAENRPDIVLLDINLAGGSGIGLLQYIKKVYPTIIVIMFTNQSGDYYRKICMQLGADYFIDKSGDNNQIPAIIASLS